MNKFLVATLAIVLSISGLSTAQERGVNNSDEDIFETKVSKQSAKNKNKYGQVNFEEGLDKPYKDYYPAQYRNAFYGAFPTTQSIHYNRVNGLFLGIGTDMYDFLDSPSPISNLDIDGLVGYSTAQSNFQYKLGMERIFGISDFLSFGAEVHNITTTDDFWRTGLLENSITSVTVGLDFHDYYKSDGFSVFGSMKITNLIQTGAGYGSKSYSSLEVESTYSLFGKSGAFRNNPAIDQNFDQIDQQNYFVTLAINPKKYLIGGLFSTSVYANAELASSSDFNNQFSFNKYQVEVQSYVKLDKRSALKWRVMTGAITGNAPDFKNFALGGLGSLRASAFKSSVGNTMFLSNAEVVIGKDRDLHLNSLSISDAFVSLFLDSGYSEFNDNLRSSDNPTLALESFSSDKLIHNVGIGLGSGKVRFEVSRSLNEFQNNTAIWIRLNPTF